MGIKPMLLQEVEDETTLDKPWIYQPKRNGVRMIAIVTDGRISGLWNRSQAPCLALFPELKDAEISIPDCVLDGEVVVERNGQDYFYDRIDARRSAPTKSILEKYPAKLVVFDLLQVGKPFLDKEKKTKNPSVENVLMKPYKERLARLERDLKPVPNKVEVIQSYTNGRELWKIVLERDWEGLVAKNPGSIYEMDTRSKQNLKLKNTKVADVLVERTEQNSAGTKIFGKTTIEDREIAVECQLGGIYDVQIGETRKVKYLTIYKDRLIQPVRT